MLAVAATCLMAALAAPTAGAASAGHAKSDSAKATASVTKKRLARDIRTVRLRVNKAGRQLKTAGSAIAALQTLANGTKSRVDTIEGLVPTVVKALTDLRDGSLALKAGLEQAGAGLVALQDAALKLKAGLEELAAGTKTLGDAYKAVEFGRAGLFTTNAATVAGAFITSADIPDDGNTITTTEDAVVAVLADGPVTIDIRAAIRSAESDGDDASETAGQAGGFIQISNLTTGAGVACAGSPAPGGIFGTQPGASIVTPSGTVNNLPLRNIPGGAGRTDTTKPDSSSPSLLPAPCTIGAATAGTVYKVHYSVNFVDIPTSTTPGPTE